MSRLRILLTAMAVMFAADWVRAAELVMFETEGCPYCEKWQQEIGEIYRLTDEAKILALRRIEVTEPLPDDLKHLPDIQFTPTFVVIEGGREVGRVEGYLGEEQFWGLLEEILKRLKTAAPDDARG
jgi:thioredoxin-related protein